MKKLEISFTNGTTVSKEVSFVQYVTPLGEKEIYLSYISGNERVYHNVKEIKEFHVA